MRNLVAIILALLLILSGVVIAGLVSVRVFRESGFLRMEIDTASTAGEGESAVALRTDLLDEQPPLVSGIESGSMALAAPAAAAPAAAAPADAPPVEPPVQLPITPTVTIDPCPPQAEGGWAADAPVAAIGMVRLYSQPDLASQPSGEFGAGQLFLVTADSMGVTAVRRCELVWVRLRLAGGVMGWALAGAIQIAPPTVAPTQPPICPGGCGTPVCPTPCCDPCCDPCTQPCTQPCSQPCNQPCTQPCAAPCGVFSQ